MHLILAYALSIYSALPIFSTFQPIPIFTLKDWKLVTSVSATERIKLWNRFGGPVDQDTVKAEFFRKVHTRNPPFRFRLKATQRERVQIPPMVVYHYRHPPSLLPTLRDVLRCENVFKKNGRSDQLLNDRELCEMVEADLKALSTANRQADGVSSEGDQEVMEVVDEADKNDVVVVEDKPPEVVEVVPKETKDTVRKEDTINEEETKVKTEDLIPKVDPAMQAIDKELDNLDTSLIKMLAYQRLQEILHENPDLVYEYQRQSTALAMREALEKPAKRSMPLPSQLLTRDDIERIAREFTTPATSSDSLRYFDSPMMARKRAKLDEIYCSNGFDELHTDAEKVHEITLRLEEPIRESKIRARAVLVPVSDVLSGKR